MEKSPADLWRKIRTRYMLVGSVCENCGTKYFPPRAVCKKCGRNTKMKEYVFSGRGEVYSFTKIRAPTEEFEDIAPYMIALIKLDEGPIVEAHVVESAKPIDIGTKVRLVFRKMYEEGDEGLIHYQYKFEPV
ncbi:MAG: Zn-ribbon domain-containing OB-fold protein [Candidatus Micrarchaeaceae archaeon]